MYEIIVAGFGGQGVLAAGVILASAGMLAGLDPTWLPAYGGEQRGGTANCSVKLSDQGVGSPYIENPDVLIAFNEPSLDKFENSVKPGGCIFVNSSLISRPISREDVRVIKVDATNMAAQIGNARAANVIMVGAVIRQIPMVTKAQAQEAVEDYFKGKSEKLVALNTRALMAGMEVTGQ